MFGAPRKLVYSIFTQKNWAMTFLSNHSQDPEMCEDTSRKTNTLGSSFLKVENPLTFDTSFRRCISNQDYEILIGMDCRPAGGLDTVVPSGAKSKLEPAWSHRLPLD